MSGSEVSGLWLSIFGWVGADIGCVSRMFAICFVTFRLTVVSIWGLLQMYVDCSNFLFLIPLISNS